MQVEQTLKKTDAVLIFQYLPLLSLKRRCETSKYQERIQLRLFISRISIYIYNVPIVSDWLISSAIIIIKRMRCSDIFYML